MATKAPKKLKAHQTEPSDMVLDCIREKKSALMIGGTGVGKTVIVANAIRRAQESGALPPTTNGKFFSVLWLGPNEIQTTRVLHNEQLKAFQCFNYPTLRSGKGEAFITWAGGTDRKGELDYTPVWDKDELPDLIVCDENQKLKSVDSQATKCVINAAEQGVPMILMSATPFQKAAEAESIFRCLRLGDKYSAIRDIRKICRYDIHDHSPTNTRQIKDYLKDLGYLIEVKNARFPFPVKITTTLQEFDSPVKRQFYEKAYQTYLEERRKTNPHDPEGIRARWVAMQKFWEAAEILRSFDLANLAIQRLLETQRQIVIGTNFLTPLHNLYSQLKKKGIPKEKISVCYGGQNPEKRQKEIDKFQRGETDFFLCTLQSGGTGLDLPHDEPGVNRQRHVIVPLCWSVYSFIQFIGRVHRMSSCSISHEEIVGYAGTIEGTDIMPRLQAKVGCIKELVDKKESFIMDIFNKGVDKEFNETVEAEVTKETKDEDGDETMFDESMLETTTAD